MAPSSLEGEVHPVCASEHRPEHSSVQLLIQAFPMGEVSLDFSGCLQLIARPTVTSNLKHSLVPIIRLSGAEQYQET